MVWSGEIWQVWVWQARQVGFGWLVLGQDRLVPLCFGLAGAAR